MKKKLIFGFIIGLFFSFLWGCVEIDSFETADRVLSSNLLPKIEVENNIIPDEVALRYSTKNISEPLPSLDQYPLYAAQPSNTPNTLYLEIYSSAEKANAQKEDERWLVDVAEQFNAQKIKVSSGKTIQVGIRNIPSGVAQRILAAKAAKPAGYTPSNELWLSLLKRDGINPILIHPTLLASNVGIVINNEAKENIAGHGELTFKQILDAILAGKLTIGYTNPFASSTGLNLLYTLFWTAAGHDQGGKPLTVAELQSPQVRSVFEAFQKQVLITALVTPDLKEIFLREPDKLPAFAVDYLSYATLKQLPEFQQTTYIPFGVPHNSPLVGFEWNNVEQQQGLKKFAEFATSQQMQQLAPPQGKELTDYLQAKKFPTLPSGEVLRTAQSFWKLQKDAGKTVYLMTVIDTSGSMDGAPLEAVKKGLRIASKEINPGNYVGLVTYGDRAAEVVPLGLFDELQHKRFLAAIDNLRADGATAMYDGMMIGLSKLMEQKKNNPDGRFYLLLLTDGQANMGVTFDEVKEVIEYSGVRVYPIAYGDVNQEELEAIASLRESTVKKGTPENVEDLLKGLFQTNL
ncbi:von Willebrand factor type A [Gloeothece citriformis PCC 7424]|uniref:von Willebrand factor type A n=1 Tax=Gloeothece citriformis (strain PCC 7424) TaxID=65393 RepID=B7KCF7_GLOC7|nr:VWA domain-containing protein [Gloeothece citriformis]ACK70262.1 von Willebrand factor type A [Gloeothece citriformis PCC 7424]